MVYPFSILSENCHFSVNNRQKSSSKISISNYVQESWHNKHFPPCYIYTIQHPSPPPPPFEFSTIAWNFLMNSHQNHCYHDQAKKFDNISRVANPTPRNIHTQPKVTLAPSNKQTEQKKKLSIINIRFIDRKETEI